MQLSLPVKSLSLHSNSRLRCSHFGGLPRSFHLAKKARITREYVSKLEAGRYDPTIGVVQRQAKALKVTVAELVE
jgi:transcriptional regulator with XRE-family HTH domain